MPKMMVSTLLSLNSEFVSFHHDQINIFAYFSLLFIVECLCVWYMCIIVLKVENSCYILKNCQ